MYKTFVACLLHVLKRFTCLPLQSTKSFFFNNFFYIISFHCESPDLKIAWMKSWKNSHPRTSVSLFSKPDFVLFPACFVGPYEEHRARVDLPHLQGTVHAPTHPALPAQRLSQMCQRAAHAKPGRLIRHWRRVRVLEPWKPSVQSSFSQHGEAGQAGPIRCVPAPSLNGHTHLTPEYEVMFFRERFWSISRKYEGCWIYHLLHGCEVWGEEGESTTRKVILANANI